MNLRSWKVAPGSFYIRRRDKLVVEVTLLERMNVHYVVRKTNAKFKVSFDGFKQGFRPVKPEEVPNEPSEVAAVTGAGSSNE